METEEKNITVWCSNDYMGMAQRPEVVNTLIKVKLLISYIYLFTIIAY